MKCTKWVLFTWVFHVLNAHGLRTGNMGINENSKHLLHTLVQTYWKIKTHPLFTGKMHKVSAFLRKSCLRTRNEVINKIQKHFLIHDSGETTYKKTLLHTFSVWLNKFTQFLRYLPKYKRFLSLVLGRFL